ncbi:MAG: hypothetical protein IPK98_09765 [Chloracidobacterium sp.]|nr:hypothetical protein [Chloracidobacterium sp.]
MRSSLARAALTLSGLVFIIIVIGNVVIVAQEAVTGTWKADVRSEKNEKENPDKIHLSFTRRTENGKNQNGSSFAYSDLQGLTREQTMQDGKVNFRLVREAGTIDCEGTFAGGQGSGTFRFTPDQSFVSAMRAKGFDFEKETRKHDDDDVSSRLMAAAFLNVTTALADDLLSANFGKLDVDDLFKAAIFKVDSKFMVEMKNSGFPDLKFEDLVKARIFKIDADYVKQVHEMGFSDHGFEGLVKFRIFKVTPEYLNELKAAGLSKMDSEDIVKCRIFKIDAEFVRKARATDPNVTIEDLVKMKIGVYRHKDKDSY